MTPLRFEEMYQAEWAELETLVDRVLKRRAPSGQRPDKRTPVPGERVASLYRRACEHLALARARSYPPYIVDRLERLTADAHQVIYHRRELAFRRLVRLATVDFPRAVRRDAAYVWIAAATFAVPLIVAGLLVYWRSELILSVVSVDTATSFEEMYSPSAESLGRSRDADTDWMMFGFYIRNNIGVAFQCFAAGLFAGVGSLFFLAHNGALGGAVAGYLTERGLSSTFFSFVATHAGAAVLMIGHALLTPGRLSRVQALVIASGESAILLYGLSAMLLVAAAVEAFWSSAQWLNPWIKYSVAAVCWTAVIAYLTLQGRRAG
jgi:uncharacterized membrane protein SpoIIM required for sporulation